MCKNVGVGEVWLCRYEYGQCMDGSWCMRRVHMCKDMSVRKYDYVSMGMCGWV